MSSLPDLGEGLLDGGGDMGAQLRAADLADTPVGSMSTWPPSLRMAVSLALGSDLPAFVTWGHSHTLFYNDAFSLLLEPGHRGSIARPARDLLQPMWAPIGSLLEQTRTTGEPSITPLAMPVALEEAIEERHYVLSLTALREETEGGVFGTLTDVTAGAMAARRFLALRELAAGIDKVRSAAEVFTLAGAALCSDSAEVPFALFYLIDEPAREATLASVSGLVPEAGAAPARIPLTERAGWPMGRVVRTGRSEMVEDLPHRFGPLPGGPGPEPARRALVVPLRAPAEARPAAIVVAALGTRRDRDPGLQEFVELVCAQAALTLGHAHTIEVRHWLEEAEQAMRREQAARLRAESDNRAKDEFIAVVSHELRAPLGSILIWTQLLRGDTPDPATLARALGMIERSTRTLAQLIDDLLDASRIIAGKLQIEKAPVDLAAVVASAVESERMAAAAKGVALEMHVESAEARVSGDARRLQQVVVNLLSNAIKFTSQDGLVEVRLMRRGGHAQVEVSDTGAGIPADFLPHIFERFRQAESAGPQKGLGLGLSISRHLVELHGGSIAAVSPGQGLGSTFVVTLPVLAGETAAQEDARGRPAPPKPRALDGIRLLLVDDEEDAREAMAVLLRHAGAIVRSVPSAAEAMQVVEAETLDVILSDIAMPVEDGYVLVRKLRQHARAGRTPALALTAYATVEDRGKALRAGYDQHMAKPVDPAQLITAVAALAKQGRTRAGA